MSSTDHNMYYVKSLEEIPNAFKMIHQNSKIPQGAASEIKLILQIGSPHFGLCVKHYYIGGTSIFNYQQSLDQKYFDKTKEPHFGILQRNFEYNQQSEEIDKHFPFQPMKKFVDMISKSMRYDALGVDYLMSERNNNIKVIDLNSIPGYEILNQPQMKNIYFRYLNTKYLSKKKDLVEELLKIEPSFKPFQLITLSNEELKVEHGAITKSCKVLQFGEGIEKGSYSVSAEGGSNLEQTERVKGFKEDFYGRVIEFTKCEEEIQEGHEKKKIYAVSDYTYEKRKEQGGDVSNLIVLDYNDLFLTFDFVTFGDKTVVV